MTTSYPSKDDLWDEAKNATPPSETRTNFGQVDITVYALAQTTEGRWPAFDPVVHAAGQRRTSITIGLQPLASAPFSQRIEREMLAHSTDWTTIVRPSLEALKVDPRSITDRFAQVEMVLSGKTWFKKLADGTLKEVPLTTFKFVKFFDSEQACEDAASAFFGRPSPVSPAGMSSNAGGALRVGPTDAINLTIDSQRATAAKFLPALWRSANGDPEMMLQKIKANGLTAKYFDLESPEVIAVVTGGAA